MAKIRSLVPELAEVARLQLGEDPSAVATKIEALRTWINEQNYLEARTDDQFLVAFLQEADQKLVIRTGPQMRLLRHPIPQSLQIGGQPLLHLV